MSSFSATKMKMKNISNIKQTAQNVAKNLELLESFVMNNENWDEVAIKNIKKQTSKLLCQLEKGSVVKLHKIIEKRKKQRKRQKLKQKLLKCAKLYDEKQQQQQKLKECKKTLETTTTTTAKSIVEKQEKECEKSLETTTIVKSFAEKQEKVCEKSLETTTAKSIVETQEKVCEKSLETTTTVKSFAEKQEKLHKKLLQTTKTTITTKKDKVLNVKKPKISKAAITDNICQKKQLKLSTQMKLHHQLRYQQQGQRFLRTFELLKILHFARGQNATATRDFNAKFDNLRAIWHKILTENIPNTIQTQQKIEEQWHEVFFGVKERVFYSIEQKQSDFMRIRRIWDTYLTRSHKHGSTIPIGYVLPKEMNVDARWLPYKKENIIAKQTKG